MAGTLKLSCDLQSENLSDLILQGCALELSFDERPDDLILFDLLTLTLAFARNVKEKVRKGWKTGYCSACLKAIQATDSSDAGRHGHTVVLITNFLGLIRSCGSLLIPFPPEQIDAYQSDGKRDLQKIAFLAEIFFFRGDGMDFRARKGLVKEVFG